MSAKLKQLERLRRLRGLRETVCEAELAKAQGALRRVELQIDAVQQRRSELACERSAALMLGERAGWWLAESASLVAEQYGVMLAGLLREKADAAEAARGRWVVSGREVEQARVMEADLRHALEQEEARRAQAVSDDRFAARAHWWNAQRR